MLLSKEEEEIISKLGNGEVILKEVYEGLLTSSTILILNKFIGIHVNEFISERIDVSEFLIYMCSTKSMDVLDERINLNDLNIGDGYDILIEASRNNCEPTAREVLYHNNYTPSSVYTECMTLCLTTHADHTIPEMIINHLLDNDVLIMSDGVIEYGDYFLTLAIIHDSPDIVKSVIDNVYDIVINNYIIKYIMKQKAYNVATYMFDNVCDIGTFNRTILKTLLDSDEYDEVMYKTLIKSGLVIGECAEQIHNKALLYDDIFMLTYINNIQNYEK